MGRIGSMKIIIKSENGTEKILYEPYELNKDKYELKTKDASLFAVINRAWLILSVVLKGIIIIGFIALFIVAPILGLMLAFGFFPFILKKEIETIVFDNGLKTVIVTYKHNYKKSKTILRIKFSDIKEIKIEDGYVETEGGRDDKIFITFVKRNGEWFDKNWVRESVSNDGRMLIDENWVNESVVRNGISMSKIIGVNCYYIDKDKKSTMLYEAQ